MCNKYNKIIIKVLKQDEIYIVKYIVKSLSEFILIFIIYILYLKTVFSTTVLNISLQIQTYKYNLMIIFLNINIALLLLLFVLLTPYSVPI